MADDEQPWMPTEAQMPFTVTLADPAGTRHLGFDTDAGTWHRLHRHDAPEPLHAGEAMFLRPSDVDQIIKVSCGWMTSHSAHPRASRLSDELADGTKQLVLAYAQQAGAGYR